MLFIYDALAPHRARLRRERQLRESLLHVLEAHRLRAVAGPFKARAVVTWRDAPGATGRRERIGAPFRRPSGQARVVREQVADGHRLSRRSRLEPLARVSHQCMSVPPTSAPAVTSTGGACGRLTAFGYQAGTESIAGALPWQLSTGGVESIAYLTVALRMGTLVKELKTSDGACVGNGLRGQPGDGNNRSQQQGSHDENLTM